MNQLSTIASLVARMDPMAKQATKGAELDNILETVKLAIKAEPGIDLTAAWAENNSTYLDFRFAFAPGWAIDGHEVKMSLSVSTEEQSWYVNMVVDCEDGEIEAWGHLDMNQQELEPLSCPVSHMLEVIHGQYEEKLREENAKDDTLLGTAANVAKLLEPHVEAIKKICKDNGMTLFADCSLDGTTCMYVVPDCVDASDRVPEGKEITTDRIPYIDLNAVKFDPNYDHFTKTK